MPFFSHFFKIEMLKRYFGAFGRHWIPFMDWGYILVFITAVILFLLGMIFILAPIHLGRVTSRHIWGCVSCIGSMVIVFSTFDWWLQDVMAGLSLRIRMFVCSLLIFPLAIPMGIPFPSGLSELRERGEEIIPWAWGINGFFSVIGSSATVLVAIGWGFKSVLFTALALYLLSAVMFIRLKQVQV